jgi:hypothetical protein
VELRSRLFQSDGRSSSAHNHPALQEADEFDRAHLGEKTYGAQALYGLSLGLLRESLLLLPCGDSMDGLFPSARIRRGGICQTIAV